MISISTSRLLAHTSRMCCLAVEDIVDFNRPPAIMSFDGSDFPVSSEPNQPSPEDLQKIMQIKSMWERTTAVTDRCFLKCISRPTLGRVSESEKNCLTNCAANFLQADLFIMKKLVNANNKAQMMVQSKNE